jgi:hypothetical protein
MKPALQILALTAALLAAGLIADSWFTARRNSAQLAATLASQNALLQRAAAREQNRDSELAAALNRIAAVKRHIQTPQQAAEAIPSVLPPLPLPVEVKLPDLSATPPSNQPSAAVISVPPADLKPLYDALQDCRACALERDAAKQNLADAQARIAALTRQRDAALAAAHGGSFWSRLKRGAKWFVIGVVAGAAAASAAHHISPGQ